MSTAVPTPIETAPGMWPPVEVVMAMQRGVRAVFHTPAGRTATGIRSLVPWVYYAFLPEIENRAGAACERCRTLAPAPSPPTSRGLNGKAEPLFGYQTRDYALFLLGWLSKFARQHEGCAATKGES